MGLVGAKRLVFNYHPLLMTLAWLVLTSAAVLAYRVLPLSHSTAKLYHAALHTCTLLLVGLGLAVVIYFHHINRYPHLSAASVTRPKPNRHCTASITLRFTHSHHMCPLLLLLSATHCIRGVDC